MSDYIKVIGSAGTNGFYPVSDGSSLASGQAAVTADKPGAKAKVIPSLPAAPAGKEWRKVTEGGTTPTTPTTPANPGSSASGSVTGAGTATYQGQSVTFIEITE